MTGEGLRMTVGAHGVSRALGMVMLAGLVVASCSKRGAEPAPTPEPEPQEDPWTPVFSDQAIRFRTSMDEPSTKTALEADFRVFAFYQPGVVGSSTGAWSSLAWTPNFMYDQEVLYSAGSWSYLPVKYWPNNEENTISFWAYSPHYEAPTPPATSPVLRLREYNENTAYGKTTHGLPDIQFTTTPEADQDLFISDLVADQSYRGGDPADGVVPLVFNHVMCKVDFKVYKKDADAYNIYLNSLTIKDVLFTNLYRQGTGWGGGSGDTGDITVYTHVANEAANLLTDVSVLPPDPLELPEGGREIIPIPQSLYERDAHFHVEYTIQPIADPGTLIPLSCDYYLDQSHRRWQMGRHYTYTIHISLGSPILFTATVTPWKTEQEGFYVID